MVSKRSRHLVIGLVALSATVITACGDDTDSSPATTGAPATTAAPATSGAPATTAAPAPEPLSGDLVWTTSWTIEAAEAYVKEFKQVHPGVNVEVVRLDSGAQVERFTTEAQSGNVSLDVLTVGSDNFTRNWYKEGWLAEYVSPEAAVYPEYQIGENNSHYVTGKLITGVCVNTEVIAEEGLALPTSWESLTDASYKGQMVMQDVMLTGSGAWALGLNLGDHWGYSPAWEDFFTRFGANEITFMPNYIEAQNQLVQGNFAVMPICYPDFIQGPINSGAPVQWLAPDVIIEVFYATAIAKDAPNPENARAFMDFMLSEAGQNAMVATVKQVPGRPGITYPENAKAAEGIPTQPALGTPTAREQFACCKDEYTERNRTWFNIR